MMNTWGVLAQLEESRRFRTNIGFLDVTGRGVMVRLQLFSSDGTRISDRSFELRGYEALQVNHAFGEGVEVVNGFATVTLPLGGVVLAYASVVDNVTGDPTYVAPQ